MNPMTMDTGIMDRKSTCPDNLANFHMYEEETDDITVIDVFNTNQELRLGEGSDTEPSSGGDRDSFGEDGFGLEETR